MSEQRPRRLEGKVAIVTGAGSRGPGVGTGKAASILLAREGAKVLLVDRVAAQAEETLDTIRAENGEASVFECDITSSDSCRAMVDAAAQRYGGLHILMNNVGIPSRGTVVDVSEEEWDKVHEVNLKSVMLVSKHAIPRMKASGGGSIINISSVDALRTAGLGGIAYASSKGGMIAMTTTMAVQHGRDNIRVNCITPGLLYTPLVAGSPLVNDEVRELRRQAAPLGTEGTAWDVAWATVFLASDESRWITGVVLPVDAGLIATTGLAMLPHLRPHLR